MEHYGSLRCLEILIMIKTSLTNLKKAKMSVDKNLSILYANMQSIRNKKEELSAVLDSHSIDIAGFQEVWTTNKDTDSSICPKGFQVVSRVNKSAESGIGGGVLVIKKKMSTPMK